MAGFITSTLMDGYAGGPHVTQVQTGLSNQAVIGPDDYVLEGGKESRAQVLTNTSIRIFDAVYCIQGRRDVIPANSYTDVAIASGSQGTNRNDIIVRRYEKNASTGIESTKYAVIKGTAVSGTAADPKVTTGDIRSGATLHEMALYRVKLTGTKITSVEPMFNILKNMATLQKELAGSNSEMIDQDDTDYMVYTLCGGKIKVVEGSIIVIAVEGVEYVKLFPKATLVKYFGSDFLSARLNITTFNADSYAQDCRYYAPEFYNGDVYQYFYPATKDGQMRINYRMEYVYPSGIS